MPVLNVAFVGSADTARSIAKLSDTRDLESYVHKIIEGDSVRVLSLLRPHRHPERLRPLLSVLNVARCGVVEIKRVDAALGEVLVAFGCAGISHGHLIIAPQKDEWVDPEQVRVIQKQAGLGGWTLHEQPPDEHSLRDALFELQAEIPDADEQPLVIPIDQHFNVKGVGIVAIGYVQSGKIAKHDDLLVLPAGQNGITRSLQVMDDDVEEALSGDRVGVALRNLREDALTRGGILVKPNSSGGFEETLVRHDGSNLSLNTAPFQQRNLDVGDVIHGAVDLQFVVGRVESVEGDDISVTWDQPLWLRRVEPPRLILAQLDCPMRVLGWAENCQPL